MDSLSKCKRLGFPPLRNSNYEDLDSVGVLKLFAYVLEIYETEWGWHATDTKSSSYRPLSQAMRLLELGHLTPKRKDIVNFKQNKRKIVWALDSIITKLEQKYGEDSLYRKSFLHPSLHPPKLSTQEIENEGKKTNENGSKKRQESNGVKKRGIKENKRIETKQNGKEKQKEKERANKPWKKQKMAQKSNGKGAETHKDESMNIMDISKNNNNNSVLSTKRHESRIRQPRSSVQRHGNNGSKGGNNIFVSKPKIGRSPAMGMKSTKYIDPDDRPLPSLKEANEQQEAMMQCIANVNNVENVNPNSLNEFENERNRNDNDGNNDNLMKMVNSPEIGRNLISRRSNISMNNSVFDDMNDNENENESENGNDNDNDNENDNDIEMGMEEPKQDEQSSVFSNEKRNEIIRFTEEKEIIESETMTKGHISNSNDNEQVSESSENSENSENNKENNDIVAPLLSNKHDKNNLGFGMRMNMMPQMKFENETMKFDFKIEKSKDLTMTEKYKLLQEKDNSKKEEIENIGKEYYQISQQLWQKYQWKARPFQSTQTTDYAKFQLQSIQAKLRQMENLNDNFITGNRNQTHINRPNINHDSCSGTGAVDNILKQLENDMRQWSQH